MRDAIKIPHGEKPGIWRVEQARIDTAEPESACGLHVRVDLDGADERRRLCGDGRRVVLEMMLRTLERLEHTLAGPGLVLEQPTKVTDALVGGVAGGHARHASPGLVCRDACWTMSVFISATAERRPM